MDYLDLQGYDGFMDIDNEAYEQRRCKFLGIPYKKQPPIHAENSRLLGILLDRMRSLLRLLVETRKSSYALQQMSHMYDII